MRTRPTDNLAGHIEDVVSRIRSARDEAEAAKILRRSAAEIQERINAERLEAAGRLAAWLAHQINNPLGTISGNAQLLARRLERDIGDHTSIEAYMRYIDGIRSQTERCARITSDLLDFTKPRDLDIRNVDVMQAVEEAAEMASYGRGHSKIRVSPCPESGLPAVRADKELVIRILYEVMVNAIHVALEDEVVNVQTSVIPNGSGEPRWVRVAVSDSGPGISDEVLPRVFEPFFSTREKARGLGLTMSLDLARRLGGTVEVSETGPGGTTVTIQLPIGGTDN